MPRGRSGFFGLARIEIGHAKRDGARRGEERTEHVRGRDRRRRCTRSRGRDGRRGRERRDVRRRGRQGRAYNDSVRGLHTTRARRRGRGSISGRTRGGRTARTRSVWRCTSSARVRCGSATGRVSRCGVQVAAHEREVRLLVGGALHSPKGILRISKRPTCVMKAVFSTSASFTGT